MESPKGLQAFLDETGISIEEVSDGYHTFKELYDHRFALFIALARSHPTLSWRAKKQHDGVMFDGWFIAGMNLPSGDITYHLPVNRWMDLDNSGIKTMRKAPFWDGHTSKDVVRRLENFNPKKK